MLKKSKQKNNYLDGIFYPKSIAVIGASNEKTKIGGFIFSQILNLKDIKKYPINVKSSQVQGLRAYERVSKIGKSVDLVIIVIPSLFVIDAVKDCIDAKVKNIVIVSAGFKEVGEEGKKREEELKDLIEENDINLVGPNCLGILNGENSMNCSFAKEVPNFGSIALISQSGAVIDAIIDWSFKNNIGFSKIVSLGNMAGIDALSILNYLKDDPKTQSIVFYMETLERGEEFGAVLHEISKKKPVIIIKPGSSENAKKAIGSHTGSLAQDNVLIETLIKENNGILVKNLNELFNVLIGLKANFPINDKVCILTNAGGPGVIATDGFENSSFELYGFNEREKKELKFLPKEASLNNPIDILGDAMSERYIETLKILNKNKKIGNIFILLTPQMMTDCEEIAEKITEISKKSNKTIYSCFLGDKEIKSALKIFNEKNFANFQTPSEAIKAMNYIYNYKNFKYD
ncbi:MAG: CoA-binding protein, partial [Nanoarchaeota archaeon]|nr:CoA-binding protein [Nanoarchaeota archaeon]